MEIAPFPGYGENAMISLRENAFVFQNEGAVRLLQRGKSLLL
jgi:hypothetical protein